MQELSHWLHLAHYYDGHCLLLSQSKRGCWELEPKTLYMRGMYSVPKGWLPSAKYGELKQACMPHALKSCPSLLFSLSVLDKENYFWDLAIKTWLFQALECCTPEELPIRKHYPIFLCEFLMSHEKREGAQPLALRSNKNFWPQYVINFFFQKRPCK